MAAEQFEVYIRQVQQQLGEAIARNQNAVDQAADWIAAALAAGRVLYVFGASHAGLLAQDLFYRAGGLVPIEPILPAGLMLNERPVQRTSRLERLPGFAATFMDDLSLDGRDVLLVISVSGRNPVAVEACTHAQRSGARVIALTSLVFSQKLESRSTSRLFEAADLTIDLPAVYGDAVVTLPGVLPMGPTSTAVGSAILHGLICEAAARLRQRGVTPPVFGSGNVDGNDHRNNELIARYRNRISYAG